MEKGAVQRKKRSTFVSKKDIALGWIFGPLPLLGVLIFSDSVSLTSIGGMVMIVVAGILASFFTRQEKQKAIESAKNTAEGLQRHLRHKSARDH